MKEIPSINRALNHCPVMLLMWVLTQVSLQNNQIQTPSAPFQTHTVYIMECSNLFFFPPDRYTKPINASSAMLAIVPPKKDPAFEANSYIC